MSPPLTAASVERPTDRPTDDVTSRPPLQAPKCKGNLDGVEVVASAYKHGVAAADIAHAWGNAIRFVEYDYAGEDRLLVIGPDRHGSMLELVAVPARAPVRIIHADRLRPSRYDFLR